jgi:hypothetical protein
VYILTEPLRGNGKSANIERLMGRDFMKYAVETGSGAMICIPGIMKTGSGIQKYLGGDKQTRRQHGYLISLLFCLRDSKFNAKL